MSCWTKEQLENMLEDVVNALDLSEVMIDEHGPLGTAPAELVRLVLERKDREIAMIKRGFVDISDVVKTKPRRIVLEETGDIREAERGDWVQEQNDMEFRRWDYANGSRQKYKIWREVKEE